METSFNDKMRRRLHEARIARLATADASGRPHAVPVCFAYDGSAIYTALDLKPKRVNPERLARVRNIRENPHVAFLIDEYSEDWTRLWYVQVRGQAQLLGSEESAERAHALKLLRSKYRQYTGGLLPEEAPVIRIEPLSITAWEP
jgi:coenzyme F420-0:L-glutamate ligase / coenzyme F420-1:gamma-L-glutamate ligase